MIILVDAGNTRIKLGWLDPATGLRESQAPALSHSDIGQVPAWLAQLNSPVSSVVGVNVAGDDIASAIESAFYEHASVPLRWINSQAQAAGVLNAYDTPGQLGTDRWVSMIGLSRHASGAPLMLASFGTATTIDTLVPQAEGRFLFQGGLILPGPALMRSSLVTGTANLPEAQGPAAAFPTHTLQAISSGIAAAQAGALLRQWREGLALFGRPPQVFSTGGGWSLVEDEAQKMLARAQDDLHAPRQTIQWLDNPVLDGLARLALIAE